jgi:hypothetical protein
MAVKAGNMRSCVHLVLLLFLSTALLPARAAQKDPPQNSFDERAASRLLLQLNEALQGHSQKQFLALFDLTKMKDGAIFRQQIASFFSQTESIRVHLNLTEIAGEGDKATAAVDAEMEIEPSNGSPVLRRTERLNFAVVHGGGSWKFVDVQPRGFFGLP